MRCERRGFRVALTVVAAVLVAAWSSAAAAAQAVATDVRVGLHGDATRIVLDLSAAPPARIFMLDAPYRVVVDMPEIGWRLPAAPLPDSVGLFSRVRYGLFEPGTTRVVIDTNGPVAIAQARYLGAAGDTPYRFVIDLKAASRSAFMASLRAGQLNVALDENAPAGGTDTAAPAPPPLPAAVPASSSVFAFVPPPHKPQPHKQPLIVLDPGHGGIDPGAISPNGTYEKYVTLSAAREFRKMLEDTGRYRVRLTRDRDVFVPLRDRVAFGREAGADLFISLHADSIRKHDIAGLSVYTLSERASDQEAAELADSENKVDLIAGIDLSNEAPEVTTILIDLAQRETMNESARFASLLVHELSHETKLLPNTHRFAGFRVLKAPDVPSVLVEMGFLSNRRDEKALLTKAYRAKLGKALVHAIDGYFARIQEAQRR